MRAAASVRGAAGFTLIEVMVALLIMSLMTVMAWSGINSLLKSREIAQAHLDHSARLQTVMAQWETDLRAVQDSGGNVPALAFDGSALRLTRQQPQGLQLVVWSLREGRLLRWEGPVVQGTDELNQSFERSLRLQSQDRGQLSALEGISAWQLYFYRGNGWSNAQSSDDVGSASDSPPAVAPPGSGPAKGDGTAGTGGGPSKDDSGPKRQLLPSGVRMVLEFAPDSGFNGKLSRQIILGPQS